MGAVLVAYNRQLWFLPAPLPLLVMREEAAGGRAGIHRVRGRFTRMLRISGDHNLRFIMWKFLIVVTFR